MLIKRFRNADEVDSVVDLENLRSKKKTCLENDPKKFFDLTHPSDDLVKMATALASRFAKGEVPVGTGLFLAEAVKGFGKSHALLTVYHFFKNPAVAAEWARALKLDWTPPADVQVVVEKFTDRHMPADALWMFLDGHLHAGWKADRPPSLEDFRAAIGEKVLVLIFDELERGIANIADPAKRSQNLSFLQMVSEEANRNRQVTLIAAVYNGTEEPGSTFKRLPRVELRFRNSDDRAAVVRHRLFSDARSFSKKDADAVIQSYINAWERLNMSVQDDYKKKMQSSYPFLPELIDLVFSQMAAGDAFQGTRGALGLLAAMVQAADSSAGLLTAAHCRLTNEACANRLQDLDVTAKLINCAVENFRDLKNIPMAEAVASATLFGTLANRSVGLTKDQLIRHVVAPGSDPNRYQACLESFQKLGSHFHHSEDRYYFDTEENEHAKVELEVHRTGNDETARETIRGLWRQDVFGDARQAVVFNDDAEKTKSDLQALPHGRPRFVLSPRHLSSAERHALYFGADERNQIILIEPKDDDAKHLSNPDFLTYAKRVAAATALAGTSRQAERKRKYESIAAKNQDDLKSGIRAAGCVYIRIEKWADKHEDSIFEVESMGKAVSRGEILDHLRIHLYPSIRFEEHLRDRLEQVIGKTPADIDRLYRITLGYPVALMESVIFETVKTIVSDPQRLLGIQCGNRSFCGERVDLSEGELRRAVLMAPWAKQPSSPAQPLPALPTTAGSEQPFRGVESPAAPVPSQPQPVEERGTPTCISSAELRQALALKLQDIECPIIEQVAFRIWTGHRDADLSGFPSAIRGSLDGKGSLDIQLEIVIQGPLSKADLEAKCERLPIFQQAAYSARLRIIVPAAEAV